MIEENNSFIDILTLSQEPYVLLESGENLKNWGREDEIIYNQQLRQIEKLKFYRNAFEFIYAHKIKGAYFEFGCHKVRTFRMALTEARKKNMNDMQFYAFDSFEGLPDCTDNLAQNAQYAPNMLYTSEEEFMDIIIKHNIYVDRVKLIKGYYENSLTKELIKKLSSEGVKASLITVDCSLYESHVAVFDFVKSFLQEGTIIYLDDYRAIYKGSPFLGVPKAFEDFHKNSDFIFTPFLDVGWFGKSFISYKQILLTYNS
ncbi:MAG: hypothetical protein HQK78_10340 [Desulfobacterales bacterium]|nr:hypothetical protein [Desulfobacterales bacterium]